MAGYRRYLAGLYAFRAPVEAALTRRDWPQTIGTWRPILIGDSLATDLSDIGASSSPIANRNEGGDMSNDTSELFGLLYVLEGSSLGARIIFEHARGLGFHETYGARHLSTQTQSTQNWKAFIALLDNAPAFDLTRAVRAANETFLGAADAFKRAQLGA